MNDRGGDPSVANSYRAFIKANPPSLSSLRQYLRRISEWHREEFKAYETTLGANFRQTVTSLAHKRGGEVFVGVNDRNEMVGTSATSQQIQQALAPSAEGPLTWYSLDARICVSSITPVPIPDKGRKKSILVVEIVPTAIPIPTPVNGHLEIFVRVGESTKQTSGLEAIDWYRQLSREIILL